MASHRSREKILVKSDEQRYYFGVKSIIAARMQFREVDRIVEGKTACCMEMFALKALDM